MGIARSRRRLATLAAVALFVLLLLAAPARAWVEQAGYDVPGNAVAACLRAGGPGELTLLGELRHTTAATDLLRIAPSPERPPARAASTTLGWPTGCAEVASARRTPTLLAGPVFAQAPRSWVAGLRIARPGGRPVRIPRPPRTSVGDVAVAAAPGGAAALAWLEARPGRDGAYDELPRVMAALRRPGATRFGRPRLVARDASDWDTPLVVGIDARGRASIAWLGSGGPADEDGDSPDDVIRLASSGADGRFSAPRDLGSTWSHSLGLAVAPDGRALLVAAASSGQVAYEREPAGRRFERVRLPGAGDAEDLAVAVRDDGAAAIVYDNAPSIFALLRTRAGRPFRDRPVRSVDEDGYSGPGIQLFGRGERRPVAPGDRAGAGVHVRIDRDGAVVASWTDLGAGERVATAYVARGTLAGGFAPPVALSSACRMANATTPVELPDGRIGVAWTDNVDVMTIADNEFREGGGRLHVARPDPPPAVPPAVPPGLSAQVVTGPSGSGAVRTGESLRLRVRCTGGPCDVRAFAEAQYVREALIDPRWAVGDDAPIPLAVSRHVPAGEERTLELAVLAGYSLVAPGTNGAPAIRLTACVPSGPVAEQVTLTPGLTGLPLRPRPQLLDVHAHREGDGIVVAWRTAEPAIGVSFSPIGYDRKGGVAARGREIPGAGQTEFSARLRDPRGRVRKVRLVAEDAERGDGAAIATVPVR